MSYGTSLADLYRQVGVYARSHPQRRKAVDLPVIQTTKFEFIINLQTARLLDFDFTMPPTLARTRRRGDRIRGYLVLSLFGGKEGIIAHIRVAASSTRLKT